jgi:UDP-glucose 4-epimerase
VRVLITGSSGHLGEALVRTLQASNHEVVGLDRVASQFTNVVGSVADRTVVRRSVRHVDAVLHAATLHKPHIVTHGWEEFVATNITGTLVLLEEAVSAGVSRFVLTSTTSVFGNALAPPPSMPAAWITEDVAPVPRNIYGITKKAAEDLCRLFNRQHGLACLILRTSRFFPEEDDRASIREQYDDANVKANEYLYRRVDLEDAVYAHLLAIDNAPQIGFGTYIISATTPFTKGDLMELRTNAPVVVKRHFPAYEEEYVRRGWRMFPSLERVYVNERARTELRWQPKYDYRHVLERLSANEDFRSPLARTIGVKGYHGAEFEGGLYPTF